MSHLHIPLYAFCQAILARGARARAARMSRTVIGEGIHSEDECCLSFSMLSLYENQAEKHGKTV
jgi:hypothetical protein